MANREDFLHQIYRYIQFPDCKYTGSFRKSEEIAISRWAAMEIAKAIMANPDTPVHQVIGEFYGQMVRCAQLANREKQKKLFRTAANAADELNAMF